MRVSGSRFAVVLAAAVLAVWAIGALAVPADAGALGDAAKGKVHFTTYCVSCHGPTGAGDGPAGAALNPKPRALNDKAYMSGLTDEHLIKVITEGGASVGKSPVMAPWKGALKPEEIKDVAAYVRTLAQ